MGERNKYDHDLWEWLKEGHAAGFISDIYCQQHEGYAMEDSDKFSDLHEEADGPDFCWSVVRIKWSDESERKNNERQENV